MSKIRSHIICKQIVEVSYEGACEPFVFRDRLSTVCTTKLLPAIEQLFDEKVSKGKTFRSDRLIVDIGELSEENWETEFVEKIIEQLISIIEPSSAFFTYQPFSSSSGEPGKGKNGNDLYEVQLRDSLGHTMQYFLETGLLPWNATIRSSIELSAVLKDLINDVQWFNALTKRLKSNDAMLRRFICQFEEGMLDNVLFKLGITSRWIIDLKAFLKSILQKGNLYSMQSKEIVYSALFKNAFTTAVNSLNQQEYNQLVLRSFFLTHSPDAKEAIYVAIHKSAPSQMQKQSLAFIQQDDFRTKTNHDNRANVEKKERMGVNNNHQQESEDGTKIQFEGNRNHVEESGRYDFNQGKLFKEPNTFEAVRESELFIRNAGLVLLHPFLPMLFDNVGYTENKVWSSEEVQQRALVLTQYMLTGKEEYPEFDLLLNKILLGYSIEKTLPSQIQLSEFEMNEANDLLGSVIKHWTALRNTSIEGLQTTFLLRNGKLLMNEPTWNLKVEQNTVDILMNKLPWGISAIKTPWMKKMMHVEWS